MEALWVEFPATAREIHTRLGPPRAYTTIMTTLDRLHTKGILAREKDGLAWRYRPLLGKGAYERMLTEHHVGQLLAAHGEVALNAFVEAADRASVLGDLARIIAERGARRP